MGNFSSAHSTSRRTTNDMRSLDVRKLQRENALQEGITRRWRWWREGGPTLHEAVIASHTSHVLITHACNLTNGMQTTYRIDVERTACHLGGHRVWWRCPAAGCNRRVAMLYGCQGAIFACRHCHHLNYKSQRETQSDRTIRKADKLRERLGWQSGIAHGPQGKPHRMRWKTYWQHLSEYNRLEQSILGNIAQRFSIKPPTP